MSYSRTGAQIDRVNGRRANGYRRFPDITNQPEPEDYGSDAEYRQARADWEDQPGRATVPSPWYVYACSPGDSVAECTHTVENLERIRRERAWPEIVGYAAAAAPARAQLRMIIDEFHEYGDQPADRPYSLAIL